MSDGRAKMLDGVFIGGERVGRLLSVSEDEESANDILSQQ